MNTKAITLILGLITLIRPGLTRAASISEPSTVFYGRIVGVDSAQPFLVTEGRLEWKLQRLDGTELTLRTLLEPLNGGMFSYRLDVPHEALILGLAPAQPAMPLGVGPETVTHSGILVDGVPARIVGPNGPTFDIAQVLRAATYRLDLEADLTPLDSDGDGVPDWWEDKFGLDKENSSDANSDLDGDGLSALAEFSKNSDPNQDSRKPRILTKSLVAYGDGISTGIILEVEDSDSSAEQLVYTLNAASSSGSLMLRNANENPEFPDRKLEIGDTFTQQDVQRGRLVLVHDGGTFAADSVSLQLRDEDPEHESYDGEIVVSYYVPETGVLEGLSPDIMESVAFQGGALPGVESAEISRLRNYLLGRFYAHVVFDGTGTLQELRISAPSLGMDAAEYAAHFGEDSKHFLLGGDGDDSLSGGLEADIIAGGTGDDRLMGGLGADRFVFEGDTFGQDSVVDFTLAERDVIDISGAVDGVSTFLSDYLSVSASESGVRLAIDANGDGSGFEDGSVLLEGWTLADVDLHQWVEQGNLKAGGLSLIPVVTITSVNGSASENGPTSGELLISRNGANSDDLAVQIAISGSASNGLDYPTLASLVVIPAGSGSFSLSIAPYVDSVSEPTEEIEIMLAPGDGYAIGSADRASIRIEDLAPQISIEVLESLAERDIFKSAMLMVRRDGLLDRSVLVRLDMRGTAANGVDYTSIPAYLNLVPGQMTALIEVKPLSTDENHGTGQTVQVSLKKDAAYKVMYPSAAMVWIADRGQSFADWKAFHSLTGAPDLGTFASARPAGSSLTYLQLYAFGIDPENIPTDGKPEGLPGFAIHDGHLTAFFKRPASVTGVEYLVESSRSLQIWNSGDGHVEEVHSADWANDAGSSYYRSVGTVSELGSLYMRVRPVLIR